MNWNLHLNDYEMPESLKRLFKKKIDDLLDVSPSDAGTSSKITRTKSGYLGVLNVFSSQGKFIVESTARDLDELINSLFQSMYGQLKTWRKGRFIAE